MTDNSLNILNGWVIGSEKILVEISNNFFNVAHIQLQEIVVVTEFHNFISGVSGGSRILKRRVFMSP